MPSEFKKIVVPTNPLDSQDVGPNFRQRTFADIADGLLSQHILLASDGASVGEDGDPAGEPGAGPSPRGLMITGDFSGNGEVVRDHARQGAEAGGRSADCTTCQNTRSAESE